MGRIYTFILITLLQFCGGEIQNAIPEWYSANLINDAEYSPKPLTEIFSTDSTFTAKISDGSSQPITQAITAETPPQSVVTLPTTFREIPSTNFENSNTEQTTQNEQRLDVITSRIPNPQTPQIMSQLGQGNGQRPLSSTTSNQRPTDFIIVVNPELNGPTSQPTAPTTQATPMAQETSVSFQTTLSLSQANPSNPSNNQQWQPILPTSITQNGNFAVNTGNTNSFIEGTSAIPTLRTTNQSGLGNQNPMLRIRVKSAKGSRTNVLVNPTSSTQRPTTTRRRKGVRRNNNYELCLDSCKGSKEPICGRPIQILPIDTDTFKGFASLCHMACHNNYRRDQYEKVADGRCGKLRTRIRPVDKNKLNRDDLNKAQYTILHNGPETILEFSPLSS